MGLNFKELNEVDYGWLGGIEIVFLSAQIWMLLQVLPINVWRTLCPEMESHRVTSMDGIPNERDPPNTEFDWISPKQLNETMVQKPVALDIWIFPRNSNDI